MEELARYDMIIKHHSGNKHTNADSLRRIPDSLDPRDNYFAGADWQKLSCDYCARAQNKWKKVEEEVDDVVPLSLRSIEQQSMSCTNWIEGMTFEDICNQQLQDHDLSKIISWLKYTDGSQPSIFEL